ncbi:MAG TPA: hypothetical protein VNW92_16370, partial [Polyangiaceae bacterium]|nr:hypothetical protein [Polyangiaceae bacterium]
SPESAAGGNASAASNVYALATLYYECLTGATPFDGENAIQILLKQQTEPVPALLARGVAEDTAPALARLIERNLAKDPATRAPDARAFARELSSVTLPSNALSELGLSSRTRRGYALAQLPSHVAEAEPRAPGPAGLGHSAPGPAALVQAPQPALGATRRALFVLLCFVLGAGAALGIATKLGAFGDKSGAPSPNAAGARSAP